MNNRNTLLGTTRMTPMERAAGRFMRAPDHEPALAAPAPAEPIVEAPAPETPAEPAAPAEAPADADGDATLIDEATGKPKVEGEAEEGETEDEKTAREAAEADAAAEAAKSPFEITAPEGFATIDKDALDAATPLLRSMGVETDEKAQEVVNQFAPIVQGMVDKGVAAAFEHQAAEIGDLRKGWAEESLKDPEIGGNPEKLGASVAKCGLFLDTFGTPGLRELMRSTGLGNHPEVIRALAKAGEALGDAEIHRGGPAPEAVRREDKFYPNTAKKT